MIKACIFDLDGTLADTLESIAYSANLALTSCGLSPSPTAAYKRFAGDGADMLLRRATAAGGDPQLTKLELVRAQYKTLFAQNCAYHVAPYAGIPELLQALKARGIRMSVFSNKPHERTIDCIAAAFEPALFDKILGQGELFPLKPAPDGALYLAQRMGIAPEECLYIGDTDTDMRTGNAAGMRTVGVTWGFRDRGELEANHAWAVVERPAGIIDLI